MLLDLSLPDCRGLETIAKVHSQAPHIPIVVLTGVGDEAVMLEAVKNGAQDYLEKGRLDSDSLSRAMRYAVHRKRAEQQIRVRALQSATIAALGEEALGNPPLDDFLRKAAGLVATSLAVELCEILESSRPPNTMVLRAHSNGSPRDESQPSWQSLADYSMRAARPVIADFLGDDARFTVSPAMHERGVTGGACVPILGRGCPFGALGVFATSPRAFNEDDTSFLQSVANVLAAAIERKRYEEELVEARDAALEVSRLKSAFLANMSHEIRTPLSGVIGMAELLLDSALDSDQTECAETIHASADALLTIVNDILEFSRISADKIVLQREEFEPGSGDQGDHQPAVG